MMTGNVLMCLCVMWNYLIIITTPTLFLIVVCINFSCVSFINLLIVQYFFGRIYESEIKNRGN